MLEHALDWARRGVPVMPCYASGDAVKKPRIPRDKDADGVDIPNTGGVKKATTDPEQIRAWWGRWPTALIGGAMGGDLRLIAIDPDAPKEPGDPDGRETWDALLAEHGGIPATHAQETPNGGRHYVFTAPEGLKLGNKEGQLKGRGVNVRGQGGYLILAPSRLADGRAYRVLDDFDYGTFAPAPQWLIDLIVDEPEARERPDFTGPNPFERHAQDGARATMEGALLDAYVRAAVDQECDAVARCARGGRNIRLNDAAFALGTLVGAGVLQRGEAEHRLWDAAAACGHVKDKGRAATLATIKSGLDGGEKKPRDLSKVRARERMDGGADSFAEAEGMGEQGADDGFGASGAAKTEAPKADPFCLIWHGDEDETPLTEWLVDETLFKVGTALMSGQWGTYKTFCGFDLSAAVMVGGTFAGRQVKRAGGVLWVAVEGQSEVRKRLAAVVAEKVKPAIDGAAVPLDPDRLPFAWVKACPPLSAPDALAKLKALVGTAAAEMKARFGVDLALVIIDTLSPAAELKDANDTAQNQHVMSVLKKTALACDTLVCAVDHMGKDTSTGTRNSSVKEADVDSVIALLGERDLAGNVSNPRLAMRKNRAAPTGWEVKFDKRVVTVGSGFDVATTLVIDWAAKAESETMKPQKAAKSPWSTAAERTLKGCLERALIDHGTEQQPFGRKGPKVKAVHLSKVRDAFTFAYAVDVDDRAKALDAKRNAFKRARESAVKKGLIQTAEIGASLVDWIWFVKEDAMAEADALDE